ncbi:hypothetical protein [Leifsonia sp. WHRI 6310E]|uniref:hypothetical protein n=1 Tax=Leifsonia sp. WHRI 6310E TaxID=3162562 RepID=UPI0035A87FC8
MPWNGDAAGRIIARGAVNGLNRAVDSLLQETLPDVPELTGGLEESARTHHTNEQELAAQVQFLKFTAVWQHERLDYRHKKGRAKFLSQNLKRRAKNLQDIVAQSIRKALG